MKRYTKSHEWIEELGNDVVRIGLSEYAQGQLGDIVFINLPNIGDEAVIGETLSDVESVKAVSEIYSPVSGTVGAVNEDLLDSPELINQDAVNTWIVEVENISAITDLMEEDEYLEFVK